MKPTNKKVIYISAFLYLLLTFFLPQKNIFSQTFTSTNYKIQWGTFDIAGGTKKAPSGLTLTDSVGQNAPGQFNSAGYIVKSGFQYAYDQVYPFAFKIDNLNLNFGSLTPQVGTTLTNIITVSTPSSKGYEILAFEDHPLNSFGTNTTIPDTTCDAGTCSETSSGVWTGNTSFGFGFNAVGINGSGAVTGVGTSGIFTNTTYFRQFANNQAGENNQIIMTESQPVKDHQARISYRIVVSQNQPAGVYQNSINFIAVPKY